MVRLLRMGAYFMVVLMGIMAARPFNAADTFAAEPRVHRVRLTEGTRTRTHETTARTVEAFLAEQEIELHPYDILSPQLSRRIDRDITVRIERAFQVNLLIDGHELQMKVRPGTKAGEVLNTLQANIETALIFDGYEDYLLSRDTELEFSTWRSEVETVVEVIPYFSKYVSTPSLSQGVTYLRQEGVNGEHRVEYMVIFVANEEYSREVMEVSITDPIVRIVDQGIGGGLGTLTDTSCPSFHYVRRVTMNASAYTAGFNCTGKHPCHPLYGITASGRRVEHGIVAVDPRVIPLGTRLYVEGYGFSLAADTGSAIRGYKIDLFMYCIYDARRFGRRDITVFILE